MRRIALVVAVLGCLLTSAWFVGQSGAEPAAAASAQAVAQSQVLPAAAPAQAEFILASAEQAASAAAPAPGLLGADEAPAPAVVEAPAEPAAVSPEAETQLAAALTTSARRGDGHCPGSAEAMAEITRAMAGWDVATASLALNRVANDNQSCASIAEALHRARAAAQHSAGFSTRRAAAGFSLRQSENPPEDGGVPGDDGGPGYQS